MIQLTDKDYKEITYLIEPGSGQVEYEKEDLVLTFNYEFGVKEYREDDPITGTGAWITTGIDLYISNVCIDGKDSLTTINFSTQKLESCLRDLWMD